MRQGLASVLYRNGISTVTAVTKTWFGRRSALGPAQAPTQYKPRALSPGVKRPRGQDIQSVEPSSLQVKKAFMNIRFVIPVLFTINRLECVYTCLTQLYVGRDMYNLLHINYMFRPFSYKICTL